MRFKNPTTAKVPQGLLTCEAFPRGKRYQVVCALQKPEQPPVFADHGIYSTRAMANQAIVMLFGAMKRNPVSLYNAFHGSPPKGVRRMTFNPPKRVLKIGKLVSLQYAPEPPSQRAGSRFEHTFGDYGYKFKKGQEPVLAVSEDGKTLMILEGKYTFGERGIVG